MSTLRVECTEPAIAALYEQYSSRIFGYCRRRLPSREEAEDAVQQTFMNAFRGLRGGSGAIARRAGRACRRTRRADAEPATGAADARVARTLVQGDRSPARADRE